MSPRERFIRIMAYRPIEQLPVLALEPFEERAIERWRTEGLPHDVAPEQFLSMSRLVRVPVSFDPMPAFEEQVVSESDEYERATSVMGATVRRRKDNPLMFYGHIDHPVKSRMDWEHYRQRFKAGSPQRLPDDWADAVAPRLDACSDPVGLCLYPFFFRLGFYAMGMERFLSAFYEAPDLIHDMFSYWSEFVLETVRPILGTVKLDYAVIAEDLAGKNGPLISPNCYREFWSPYQTPVIEMLRDHGVPLICQWTSGRVDRLLPEMMDQGFNCTWPMEVIAGMDAAALRKRFGRELRMAGNIAKEAVIAGPRAIDREVERLMPLMREGGFIPALDDVASPDMPFPHYRYLIDKLHAVRLDG
jgi:uroporphyrinogen decarboxylase